MIIFGSLLLLLGCTNSQSQNKNAGYIIKGSIKGVSQGTVKLVSHNEDDRTSKILDSVNFQNGKFEIQGKTEAPQMVSVVIEPGNWTLQAFLENKPLSITIDTAGANYYDYTMCCHQKFHRKRL